VCLEMHLNTIQTPIPQGYCKVRTFDPPPNTILKEKNVSFCFKMSIALTFLHDDNFKEWLFFSIRVKRVSGW
jgi:hypothetical protein